MWIQNNNHLAEYLTCSVITTVFLILILLVNSVFFHKHTVVERGSGRILAKLFLVILLSNTKKAPVIEDSTNCLRLNFDIVKLT